MGCNLVLLLLVSGLLAEGAHAILCYQCDNCEGIEGEGDTENCSISSSSFCLSSKNLDTGEITKRCGAEDINFLNFSNSCDRKENQIACHCDTDLCNINDLLPSTISTIADIATSSTNSTTLLTQLVERIPTTAITAIATVTTTASTDEWYCHQYQCLECGSFPGHLVNCATVTTVRACVYFREPNGNEIRGCTSEDLDAVFEVGCDSLNGYTACKCVEPGCNLYPNMSLESTTVPPTTAPAATVASTTDEFYCYECIDCELDTGVLTNCANSTTSRSCYYARWANGTVLRNCGSEGLDQVYGVGCGTVLGYTICRCEQSGCNEYLPPAPVSESLTTTTVVDLTTAGTASAPATTATVSAPTTTTTTVSALDGEPWTCYSCHDCGNSTGEIVTCSLIPAVSDCQLIKHPSGKIQRSCGRTIADTEAVEFGCSRTYRGYQWCRCNEINCNEYPDITESAPDASTATTMLQTTTAIQSTTAGEPPFSCYVCRNCGSTAGFLVDCSPYTESKTCLLMKQPNGEVLRLCSTTELDAQLRSGCHTRRGYTFCKCSENACNAYPEVSGVTTTIPPTTTEPPFLCHICHDCGTELGPSLQCTSANSCSFILQQRIVIRSCGSPLLDLIITEDEGCTTTDNGRICKCSTPNCNIYNDITDSIN